VESPEPGKPNLDCLGALSWTKVKAGATVKGSFQVQNIGETGSFLNWTVNVSSIDWGTWSFNPESGENLKREDGQVNIEVSLITPKKKNSKFEGFIKVENKQDPEDFELIPVNLKTQINKNSDQTKFLFFILKFLNLFSEKLHNLFKIVNMVFNY